MCSFKVGNVNIDFERATIFVSSLMCDIYVQKHWNYVGYNVTKLS